MSVAPSPILSVPPPPLPLRPFSVDEYHRMIEADVLTADDPVELLEGWVVFKMPRNPQHDTSITRVEKQLRTMLPDGWYLRVQMAITTIFSEPEPDVAVVLAPETRYAMRHPVAQDLALVIAVADSSLMRDRREMARAYARAGIIEYWIANLVDRQLEALSLPSGPTASPAYAVQRTYGEQEGLPLIISGQQVGLLAVHDLLA